MASQVAALRGRVATDGLTVSEALQFLAAGSRGATLVRPALERLRDGAAAGSGDRLSGHSPERLARPSASPVLWGDARRRAGGEVVCLTRALGQSPEEARLWQVPGRSAEAERATRIERPRRGPRHAARAGVVQVLRGAP
jgi:site-specific DNA recombinase